MPRSMRSQTVGLAVACFSSDPVDDWASGLRKDNSPSDALLAGGAPRDSTSDPMHWALSPATVLTYLVGVFRCPDRLCDQISNSSAQMVCMYHVTFYEPNENVLFELRILHTTDAPDLPLRMHDSFSLQLHRYSEGLQQSCFSQILCKLNRTTGLYFVS
jgi:hypothetical protein